MTAELITKQRLARLGYQVGERAGLYRRRIIGPDGSEVGAMNVWEANAMLAKLEAERAKQGRLL